MKNVEMNKDEAIKELEEIIASQQETNTALLKKLASFQDGYIYCNGVVYRPEFYEIVEKESI